MDDEHERYQRARAALSLADREIARSLEARASAVRAIVALRAERPEAYLELPTIERVLEEVEAVRREVDRALPDAAVEPIFREILGACALIEAPRRIAVAGADPGHAALAARRVFGSLVEIILSAGVTEALREVVDGEAHAAIIPLETSRDGTNAASLFALAESPVRVIEERSVPNAYHLYSRTGNVADIDKVYATPVALAGALGRLERELASVTKIEVRTAEAAVELALADHGAAALVASAADARDLVLARSHVEDDPAASTRFVVVARDAPRRTGRDQTMLVLELGEEPGTLYAALAPFAARGVNLTRVESRRAPGARSGTAFFLEFDGHVSDRSIVSLLDEVREKSRRVKVLGSFPRPEREGGGGR